MLTSQWHGAFPSFIMVIEEETCSRSYLSEGAYQLPAKRKELVRTSASAEGSRVTSLTRRGNGDALLKFRDQ